MMIQTRYQKFGAIFDRYRQFEGNVMFSNSRKVLIHKQKTPWFSPRVQSCHYGKLSVHLLVTALSQPTLVYGKTLIRLEAATWSGSVFGSLQIMHARIISKQKPDKSPVPNAHGSSFVVSVAKRVCVWCGLI